MIKYIVTIILVFIQLFLAAQSEKTIQKKVVKTSKTYTNGKLTYYYENDKNGNTIFSKNNGMNGNITMLFVSEFDSLNRETRIFFAHSNIGFSLSEKVYDQNKIYHYQYKGAKDTINPFDRETLNKINTQNDFLQLDAIKFLLKKERQLNEIEILDSANNVITEIYISETGDTTSINSHVYNSDGKEYVFHYGLLGKEPWIWDIYYEYDLRSNLTQSYRLTSKNGIKVKTEVRKYHYNCVNVFCFEDYYNNNKFVNKTSYGYNKYGQIEETYFYENEEQKVDVFTSYKYDKHGKICKKITKDFREKRKGVKNIFTYKLKYW